MMRLLAASLLVWLYAIPVAHAQVNLGWKLKPGDRFYVEETTQARQTMVMAGNLIRQQVDQTKLLRYTVVSIGQDGSLSLEKKIERLKVEPASGRDRPADIKLLVAVEGATFHIIINSKGEVEKFDGHEPLIKRIASEDSETARLLRIALTPDSLKATTETLFHFPPGKEVAKGDRWQRTARINLGPFGLMTGKSTYTFLGEDQADKSLVKIGVSMQLGYLLPKTPGPIIVTQGLLRSDEAHGTVWFHIHRGRPTRIETRRVLKGNLTVVTANGATEMELTQHQTTQLRLSDHIPK